MAIAPQPGPGQFLSATERNRLGLNSFYLRRALAVASAANAEQTTLLAKDVRILSGRTPTSLSKVETALGDINATLSKLPAVSTIGIETRLGEVATAIARGGDGPMVDLSGAARLILNFTTQLRAIVLDKHPQRADQKLGQLEHIQKQLAERFAAGSEAARQCRGLLAPAPDLLKSFEGFSVLPSLERIDAYVQALHRFESEVMRRVQDPPPAPTDGTAATKSK